MNIVTINTHDQAGGAAKVAHSLHRAFVKEGHRCRFLVRYKRLLGADIVRWETGPVRQLRRITRRLERRLGLQYLLDPSLFLIGKTWMDEADVVHLHNIHGSYFNPLILPTLSRRYCTIWTLHDMWALTGRCAHSFDCKRWQEGCGQCPSVEEYPALSHDTSSFHWRVKRAIYQRSELTVVVPSRWLQRLAGQSILGHCDIRYIPNGVDVAVFRPMDRHVTRQVLGLPEDRFLILCAGTGVTTSPYKGFDYLAQALRNLNRSNILLAIIGGGSPVSREAVGGHDVINVGRVDDEELMAHYYACADVFAFPSVAENCPLAVLEAMSSSTPVVAFQVGGIPDLIQHGKTGYLARARDVEDLARGIRLLLEQPDTIRDWGRAAREAVLKEFTLDQQVHRYLDLYAEKLEERNGRRNEPKNKHHHPQLQLCSFH